MKNNLNLETCLLFHKVPVFKRSAFSSAVSGFEEKFTKQIFSHRLQLSNGGENISLKENSGCLKLHGDECNFSNAGEFWAFLGVKFLETAFKFRKKEKNSLIIVFTFSIQREIRKFPGSA